MNRQEELREIVALIHHALPFVKIDLMCQCGRLESEHTHIGSFCDLDGKSSFSPLRGIPLACGSGDEGRMALSSGEGKVLSGSTTICQCGNSLDECDCPEPDPRVELYDDPGRGTL